MPSDRQDCDSYAAVVLDTPLPADVNSAKSIRPVKIE